MKITIVTKNPGKIKIYEYIFSQHNIEHEFIDNEFPEIQAETSQEIAEHTATLMCQKLKCPVIREDASFFINALNFPGPYTHYMEKMIPAANLLKMLANFSDRSGYFETAVAIAYPNEPVKTFILKYDIEINDKETGNLVPQGAWDTVIKFKGETRTFGEYPIEERVPLWAKPYKEVAEYILQKQFAFKKK